MNIRPHEPQSLFRLRVCLPEAKPVSIEAFAVGYDERGATCYRVVVRHLGREVFGLEGPLFGAFSPMQTDDGIRSREHVMGHVAMRPSAGGGEGDDFYGDYSPAQLEWVERWGQDIDLEREARYCDPETGDVR